MALEPLEHASAGGLDLSLRPIRASDEPFLLRVYGESRAAELAMVPWTDEQKTAFLAAQFAAQHVYYQEYYAAARFLVVEVAGVPAGRLYLNSAPSEVRIVDIAVLPEFRGLGVGSALLEAILTDAASAGVPVTIHVERNNPALNWYTRYGFELVEDKGVYLFLQCTPNGRARSGAE